MTRDLAGVPYLKIVKNIAWKVAVASLSLKLT